MSDDYTVDEYTRQLHELIDGRMEAGRTLAAAAGKVREARAALEAAEGQYAAAFQDALKAGWTNDELKRVFKTVGVEAPTRPRRSSGRRRSSASTAPTPQTDAATAGDEGSAA
ncbi:hypothetical protein [Puerhibacterium puerhi]|uniref:hypothetical protein n=1 Tax=Puerhibacterium puerhi TaxID=2692623 RepID=UPI00135C7D9C|nr:hypothetical protein [Puerhibacterium puerhi]